MQTEAKASHRYSLTPYAITLCLLLAGGLGFGYTRYTALQGEMASSTMAFQTQVTDLNANLNDMRNVNANLTQSLNEARNVNIAFQGQIADISNSVGTLQKLKSLDPELLEKYSKVYFLNENYIPKSLANIDPQYLFDPKKPLQIETNVKPFLQNMLASARSENIIMQAVSAYRSFSTQTALKAEYKVTYGSGANKFSADQGYSEHQIGSTVDLTTSAVGGALTGFEKTSAFVWLNNNAYRYGFILSYPDHNAYYEYEPWHWRFVGIKLATALHDQGKHFYDLDQRDIDTYLITVFDN